MAFDFVAIAQDKGIIFAYNNYRKAVYVYRQGEEIKEREVREEEIEETTLKNKLLQDGIRYSIRSGGILILLEIMLILGLKIKISILCYIYIIMLILYTYYIIEYIKYTSHSLSKRLKQYHSAEHMIFNAGEEEITSVEQLKKFSKYANDCNSNDNVIKILNFLVTGTATITFYYANLVANNLLLLVNITFKHGWISSSQNLDFFSIQLVTFSIFCINL